MIKHNFPEELTSKNSWIIHKEKVPKNPKTGKNLTGPVDKWGANFNDACKALEKYKASGLGFVFTAENDYCGIDLDSCIENGVINEKAKNIINSCDSYTEKSFSGTGIHIIVKSTNKEKKLYKKNGVEIYDRSRYFTMSGFGLNGNNKINVVNVNDLLQKIIESKNANTEQSGVVGGLLNTTQINELVERVSSSGSGDKFKIMWRGDWEQLYESHSEADMAFCNILAFWLSDAAQIDQIFRASKMFRDKWDRSIGQGKTYGKALIEKVMLHREGSITANSVVVEIDVFRTMEMPEIKTIMSPWLSFGSTHMIYAKRGAGKTFFALSLSLAATHNANFGDWELHESVNTMYVDGEMLPQQMKERIADLQMNYGKKEKNWYILSSGINLQNNGLAINIAKPYWQDFIYNEIMSKDIKLLFLDNISALTPGIEENESTSWDVIAAWLNKIKQTGCAVVLVHHAGKGGQQRGTSAREDALDTVIFLRKTTEDATVGVDVDIVFEKARHISGAVVATTNARLLAEPGTGNLIWNFSSSGTSKRNEILQMLVDGKSYEDIRDKLQVSKATITKHKKEAIERNWIGESGNSVFFTTAGTVTIKGEENSGYGF
jgi:DNA-binding CsgD family transcriptional regulator